VCLQIDGRGRGRGDERDFCFPDIAIHRQCFVGRQRTDHHRHFVAFDQFLRLGPSQRRIAGRVLPDQLDLAAGDHAAAFLQKQCSALFLLLAASRQRTGIDGEKSDLERLACLCPRPAQWPCANGRHARKHCAARKPELPVTMSHPPTPQICSGARNFGSDPIRSYQHAQARQIPHGARYFVAACFTP